MANIKNFGLVGIGGDVQFGKGGSRLIASSGSVLSFKAADGELDAIAKAGELHALGLVGEGVRVAAVDASGKLTVGAQLVADLASKSDLTGASTKLDELARDIAAAAGLTLTEGDDGTEVSVTFTGGVAAATNLREAIELLQTNSTTALADGLATKLSLAGGTMTGPITLSGAPVDALHAATKGYVDAAISGLSWENPVEAIVADINAADALAAFVVGDRVYDAATGKIHTITAEGVDAGEAVVEGAAFFNRANDAAYVFNGTAMVQFSGGGSLVGGHGIELAGNEINVDFGNGLVMDENDKLVLKLASLGALGFSAEGELQVKLDGDTLVIGENGLKVNDTALTSINDALASLQVELDASQAALGLGADGELVPFTGSTFLSGTAEIPAVMGPGATETDPEVVVTPAIPGVPAPATYHAALLALDAALKAQKDYTDAEIQALGSMSLQDSGAVAITGGAIAADSLAIKGAHLGSLVFVGADGQLMSDDAGVQYDASSDTLSVGAVVITKAPTEANHVVNKAYVDALVSGGVENVARGLHIAFADGVTTLPAIEGLITRIKVKITTPGTSVAVGSVVPVDMIDAEEAGVYIVEAADLINAAMDITSVGASGIVIVEYLDATVA